LRGQRLAWPGRRDDSLGERTLNLPCHAGFTVDDTAEPLGKRAPAIDENGNALSDFMMIFPRLREQPEPRIRKTIDLVHEVLARYHHAVVFAEFNLKLNLLWVSIRPITGIRFEIARAMQEKVPLARLVSHI
jgi:hypothetical protein